MLCVAGVPFSRMQSGIKGRKNMKMYIKLKKTVHPVTHNSNKTQNKLWTRQKELKKNYALHTNKTLKNNYEPIANKTQLETK